MKKIIITKNKKAYKEIIQNLSNKNLHSIIPQPLFSVIKTTNLKPEINQPQAVIITSSNAIFALKKLQIENNTLILSVGSKTAERIRKLGYNNVLFVDNSAFLLLNLSKNILIKNQGTIVYLAGEIITLDLAKKLEELGFVSKKIIVYKTKEVRNLLPQNIEEIKNGNVEEVWIYSKNSLMIFYRLVKKYDLLEYLEQTKISCLSQEIANCAKKIGFYKTTIFNQND